MSIRARVLVVVLSLFCMPCLARVGASPQEKSRPQAAFRGSIEMVTVDVSVLGRDRQPVRGLKLEDFTILEDGRPQPIGSFGAVDFPETEPTSAAWMREVASDVHRNDDLADRRLLVLVLDDATPMDPEDAPRLKTMARAVVDRLGPRDLAVVVFSLDKKSGQDLTSDHARLLAAIDRFAGGVTMDSFTGKSTEPGGVTMNASDFDLRALSMYEATLDTLRTVSEDLGALSQRRKAVVLASVGLPLDVVDAGPRVGLSGGKDSGLTRRLLGSLQGVFEAAERANVNMYGLGPGLKAAKALVIKTDGSANRDASQMNTDFLRTMSAATGGFAIVDTDDPGPGITQVLRENGAYYLLAYEPTNTRTEGRFRRIEVRVNRPDVTIRARTGYYESASAARPAAKASLQTALQSFVPQADLAMQVAAAPFAIPGQRNAAIAVMVGVRQPTPAVTERTAENTDVQVSAYDESGQRRGAERLQVAFTLRPGSADEVGYETLARLDLAPGRYQLRLAAQTTLQGRTGSVYCDLDVPDFSKPPLSLSGIALSATPAPMMVGKDKLASLLPVVPTAMRDFTGDQKVIAFLRVYQGGKDAAVPVPIAVRIVNGSNATVFESAETLPPDRFAPGRAADYRLDLPLARLAPGPHLLTVEGTLATGTRARRDVRFIVH
jgi:VWFA-related protein